MQIIVKAIKKLYNVSDIENQSPPYLGIQCFVLVAIHSGC